MTSQQSSQSHPSEGEDTSMPHRLKRLLKHKKDTITPQAGSQGAQSDEGSSVYQSKLMI